MYLQYCSVYVSKKEGMLKKFGVRVLHDGFYLLDPPYGNTLV
jgi:hypothetical protein